MLMDNDDNGGDDNDGDYDGNVDDNCGAEGECHTVDQGEKGHCL